MPAQASRDPARRLACRLVTALVLLALCGAWGGTAGGRRAVAAAPGGAYTIGAADAFIYVPADAAARQPLQVLVALHGMGNTGPTFCRDLLSEAGRNGWVVLAPTFAYGDNMTPGGVLRDDTTFLPRLAAMLDALPARIGYRTRPKVLLYGHSRGGQEVHRFATFYPDRVLGAAVFAAGTYTLPLRTMPVDGQARPLPFPFGVADLKTYGGHDFDAAAFARIPFWIGVGGLDDNAKDAPRAWDPYVGATRLERARRYARALQQQGLHAALAVYPTAGHGITPAMREDALAFLEDVARRDAGRTQDSVR
ncbi:MAG TPA: hypothetical protein VFW96_00250 [Thermomicrobiales bacterium]|nr:hypothetical protein [Thermomicrobiales bacterium]